MPDELTFAVVVPSYRRPESLRKCLEALLEQQLAPAEIVVVSHVDDLDNHAVVAAVRERAAAVRLVTVDRLGVVHALEAGMRDAHGDIIAFTDDDARPHRDWLARLRVAFCSDSTIAGVGGRDAHAGGANGRIDEKRRVGRVAWFGRVSGNHHSGVGGPREVHVLKGVNCAYRRSVLEQVGYDHRLRGQVEHHHELALGLSIVRRGGRLVYDPAILVDHEEAPRPQAAPRIDAARPGTGDADCQRFADAVFNEALALSEHLSNVRRLSYRIWSTLVGHRDSPGLVQAIRFTPTLGRRSWRLWRIAEQARREARQVASRRS